MWAFRPLCKLICRNGLICSKSQTSAHFPQPFLPSRPDRRHLSRAVTGMWGGQGRGRSPAPGGGGERRVPARRAPQAHAHQRASQMTAFAEGAELRPCIPLQVLPLPWPLHDPLDASKRKCIFRKTAMGDLVGVLLANGVEAALPEPSAARA